MALPTDYFRAAGIRRWLPGFAGLGSHGIIAVLIKHAATEAGEAVADHPNRHIREALKYVEEQGWTIRKSGPRAHAWGVIFCSFGHRACWMAIYSTPKNPERHARDIRRTVDRCTGA